MAVPREVKKTVMLVFGKCSARISVGAPTILIEVFLDILQSLHADTGVVPQSKRQPLAVMSLPIQGLREQKCSRP
jgi:hypothetical protein